MGKENLRSELLKHQDKQKDYVKYNQSKKLDREAVGALDDQGIKGLQMKDGKMRD